jgi:hypothetical protein
MLTATAFSALLARHMIRTGAALQKPEADRLRLAAEVCSVLYTVRPAAMAANGFTYAEKDDLSGDWRPLADGVLYSAAETLARKATDADLVLLLALAWESAALLRPLAALTPAPPDRDGEDRSAGIAKGFWPGSGAVLAARSMIDAVTGEPPPAGSARDSVVETHYRDLPIPGRGN